VVRHSLVQRIIKAYEERVAAQTNGANAGRNVRAAGAIPPGENRTRE
jgi:hypothetical protein